ncbi:hypothetical protein EHO57_13890 [Leptospira langatensis]|uniref:Uncharacterized protein n=1 Tax=Leptospira langatensis TaxID=2484983 RepID=A0A5R2ASX9_9LEPT|nr:hypothetical protein [Leptospira langatensis]TGJ99847.1 hypothetical protein EHO57_13890 [Leptospira langatensis]
MAETEFLHPLQILKASPVERTGAIEILVRASSEKEDRQGETILKSAYADPLMRQDLCKSGYMDYNHLTDLIEKYIQKNKATINPIELTSLQHAKTKAIIGGISECGFKDDFSSSLGLKDDGFYLKSQLFPDNEFVKEIRKGLAAGWHGWGASVSGFARPQDVQGKTIKKIRIRKCALAPLDEVVNQDTEVQLIKGTIMLRDFQKSLLAVSTDSKVDPTIPDVSYEIREQLYDVQRKIESFGKLMMLIPEFSDQIIQSIFSDILARVKNGKLENRSADVRDYLKWSYGFSGDQLDQLTDAIFLNLNGE